MSLLPWRGFRLTVPLNKMVTVDLNNSTKKVFNMCGVVGVIAKDTMIDKNNLQNSISILNHRGPDCQKIWLSNDGHVGLGHARLSIIDLVTGDQPLTNEDHSLHLVANGEFYGFERLRSQLQKNGHTFSTRSDSEIVLHLYEDKDVNCLEHLRGEFAFILWDQNKKVCFAARDRFGIKPLYYSVFNNKIYLASEVKALFAQGIPAVWDMESIGLFVSSTLNKNNRTNYKNIYQLPPGHYLLAKDGKIQIHKYWDLDYPKAQDLQPTTTTSEYILQLREKLTEAVQLRLRADVPIACYLSGGLDSSAVLGLAAKHYDKKMPAFTLTFDNEDYDEEKIAKEMAEKANASFHPISIKQSDLATNFDEALWHSETFFYNGHGIAKFLLSKAVRDAGYKVVLTGEGADELFAGYPHFRVDQIFYGKYKDDTTQRQKMLAELEKANLISLGTIIPAISNSGQPHTIDSLQQILGYTPSWLLIAMQAGVRMSQVLAADFKTVASQHDSYKEILANLDIENQLRGRDPVNQSLYLWSKFRLCDYILTVLGDRMEMAHSLEGRVPFLDHHVAEFMRNVPVNLKIHEMTEKYLLREAASPVLTDTVYQRQKHPFLAPPALLGAKQPFEELLQTTLRSNDFANIPFFNQKKIIELLDTLPNMSTTECIAWDPILMTILSLAKLQQQFKLTA